MDVKLKRKCDGEIITKSNVKSVGKNFFGNIRLVFENGNSLTLQSSLFEVVK
jgi:hypothetical protein